ncbi:MAG: 50S ribosomal protein L5 [Patescibacteria group bacterium]|jgi:large subunit ribosomal protein L5
MKNRLYEKYQKVVIPAMKKDFSIANAMEVPKLSKIVINAGVGSFRENREAFEYFIQEMSEITGQKPHVTKAKKSESGFKIRKNDVVGVAVTLRSDRMWAFLDKMISVVLPRVRDFRGLKPTAFDNGGNYSIGVREHTIFPEVNPNKTKGIRSMQITLVTNHKDLEKNKALMKYLGLPLAE